MSRSRRNVDCACDDFVHGGGSCGGGAVGGVPDGDGVPVVEGGPLSRLCAVSREFMEAGLGRWRGLLEGLGSC